MMTDLGHQRTWMEGQLHRAATEFAVELIGDPLHTNRLHSVGSRVLDMGEDAWLRVVHADPEWGEGAYLDGNVSANIIRNVPKPYVKRWQEWTDRGRQLRGEVSTFVAGSVVSTDMVPASEPTLSPRWLSQLNDALEALAGHPVPDHGVDPEYVNDGLLAFFGITVDFTRVPWTAAHCDLHWANVTSPNLFILDWEIWGRAPAGYDAATLYCASLMYPKTAHLIHNKLSTFLETDSGRVSTLAAAVRLLRFIDSGEFPALAQPLRRHALEVIDKL